MRTVVSRSFDLLTSRERGELWQLIGIMVVNGLIEVGGIASLGPFLAIASNPEVIQSNEVLHWLYVNGGYESSDRFLFIMGLAVFLVMILANFMNAFTLWRTMRFSWMRNHSISERLLVKYLNQPYVFFLNRNSSDLVKNLFSEVQQVVNGILVNGAIVLARVITTIFITIFLIHLDPRLALGTATALGGAYGVIYALVRKKLAENGEGRVAANGTRYKVANEVFGGIKDVKILGRESVFVQDYSKASKVFARYQADHEIISQMPRFLLEVIAFGGILLLLLYLLSSGQDITEVIPLLGLYAFAGYRLMPAVRQIFMGLTNVKYNTHALSVLHADLANTPVTTTETKSNAENRISLENEIVFNDITFSYPGASSPTIKNLQLNIPARKTVAFVGSTGCGKTTSIDLLLGLLSPDSGEITVDGININDSLRSWQDNVGYVSQHIYLADDSITANIAFGVPPHLVDLGSVKTAAQVAAIDSFITEELRDGYMTIVGERGVRLSGGQRQRIGIARALYRNPDLLVLDEATSALDSVTEEAILKSIERLSGEKTIVMIAHRLATVRKCDRIFVMDGGRLVGMGTYDELISTNEVFQKLAAVQPAD